MGLRCWMLVAISILINSFVSGQDTPSAVYVDTLRSFEGAPTDPECTNGGPFDTPPDANNNFACNIPASRLTDGELGENSSNFNQFSAWNRTTDMPRVFFLFPNTIPASTFYISQIDLYFYKSAALRVGLPDIRFDIAGGTSIEQDSYLCVAYTIVSDQSVLDNDNQTVKVSLVDTLGQRAQGYTNNIVVRLTFDFSSSDTLDWLLLSEVRMFNDTAVPAPPLPQPPIIFTQDQVTVVRHNATDLVSSERLTCSVTNEAVFEWSWTGQNGATTNVFVADLTRTGVLQISSLSLSDAGDYNCTAAFFTAGIALSFRSQNSSIISLQLEGLVTPSDPVTINNGNIANLSCKFSGYLPRNPTFSWENSQGMMISDDSKFTIQSTMDQTMLTIGSVIQTDGGDYTCRMRGDNNAELSGTARLTVFGPSSTTLAAPATAASTTTSPSTTPATAPPLPIVAIGAGGGIAAIVIVGIIIVVIVIIVVVVNMKNRKKGEATFAEDYAEVTKAPQPPPIPDYFYNKGYAEITTTANGHIELVQPHHSHQASDSTDYPMPAKLKAKPEYLQPNPMYASADHLNNWEPGGMRSMKPAGSMPLLDSSASPFNSQFNIYAEPSKVPPPVPSYHGSLDGESLFNEDINPDVFQEPNNEQLSAAEVNPVHALYANPQPIARSDLLLEVKEKNIREIKELGMGQFGLVVLAHTVGLSLKQLKLSESNTDPGVSIVVAVKRLKPDADATTREAFEKEIKFMARLNHENVVRLVGVCLSHNAFIMMQYMENGDLNQFLRSKSLSLTKMPLSEDSNFVIIPHLIYVSLQVAAGMRYLASLHFIHRDLATRNCLVGQDFTVKIADFGMSRDLYDSYYYTIRGKAMLPIRWMANECFYGQFSEKTDVWAFGVTMWEIFTLCKKQPYEEFSDQDVINDAIQASERKLLSQPRDCPSEVYHVMLRCWVNEPKERANFDELHQLLSQIHAYSDLS